MLERLLYLVGYAIAPVLFFRAETTEGVVRRLRLAYRLAGVTIDETRTDDGVEYTEFTCPYRGLLADEYGQRYVCHQKLDRVDDGYVSYLRGHKDVDYRRPRACDSGACCYSEVQEL